MIIVTNSIRCSIRWCWHRWCWHPYCPSNHRSWLRERIIRLLFQWLIHSDWCTQLSIQLFRLYFWFYSHAFCSPQFWPQQSKLWFFSKSATSSFNFSIRWRLSRTSFLPLRLHWTTIYLFSCGLRAVFHSFLTLFGTVPLWLLISFWLLFPLCACYFKNNRNETDRWSPVRLIKNHLWHIFMQTEKLYKHFYDLCFVYRSQPILLFLLTFLRNNGILIKN